MKCVQTLSNVLIKAFRFGGKQSTKQAIFLGLHLYLLQHCILLSFYNILYYMHINFCHFKGNIDKKMRWCLKIIALKIHMKATVPVVFQGWEFGKTAYMHSFSMFQKTQNWMGVGPQFSIRWGISLRVFPLLPEYPTVAHIPLWGRVMPDLKEKSNSCYVWAFYM